MSVICIHHPDYSGEQRPLLSCKACCVIYVDKIMLINNEANQKRFAQVEKFVEEKSTRAAVNPSDNINVFI